jgi:hypothetical protein
MEDAEAMHVLELSYSISLTIGHPIKPNEKETGTVGTHSYSTVQTIGSRFHKAESDGD